MRRAAGFAIGILFLLLFFQLPLLLPRPVDELVRGRPAQGRMLASSCPADMVFVAIGSGGFCIDRYEAPDRRGVTPMVGLSLQQAIEHCGRQGRRLCTSGEWYIACGGADAVYAAGCVNPSPEPSPSGGRPGCVSPRGVADLPGNVLEWTSDGREPPAIYMLKGGSHMTPDGYTSCGYEAVVLAGQVNFARPDLGVRCCL